MQTQAAHSPPRLVEYDVLRRRLWILGQRCHHGATGAVIAVMSCLGLIIDLPADPRPAKWSPAIVGLAAGGAMMLHDWQDRAVWFERGRGSQR